MPRINGQTPWIDVTFHADPRPGVTVYVGDDDEEATRKVHMTPRAAKQLAKLLEAAIEAAEED
jgi:K+/H+ antiporter YhaU regulatory subunit KhtT